MTKKFGIVGTALFPTQVLLSLKHGNPVAVGLGISHQDVNKWHRVLGRVIYAILACHTALYLNKYIQTGTLQRSLRHSTAVTGLSAFVALSFLSFTSSRLFRRLYYRVFYISHFLAAFAIPLIIFFHSSAARVYMTESIFIILANIILQMWHTATAQSTIEKFHRTSLIKIVITAPKVIVQHCHQHPGSYVYLSIPRTSRPKSHPLDPRNIGFGFTRSPFTVAAVKENTCELTLVARKRSGPITRNLARLADQYALQDSKIPLHIEGPHGASTHLPDLIGAGFGRILLFAGGVGATFTLPIYQSIIQDHPQAQVDMFWAVRSLGDVCWAIEDAKRNILHNDRIHLFVTGSTWSTNDECLSNDTLDNIELGQEQSHSLTKDGLKFYSDRPDLKAIVNTCFHEDQASRVAILVCGSSGFVQELRNHVHPWVGQGRDVWWHSEWFGS
jgi:NAD(P)H-flavin reductase